MTYNLPPLGEARSPPRRPTRSSTSWCRTRRTNPCFAR